VAPGIQQPMRSGESAPLLDAPDARKNSRPGDEFSCLVSEIERARQQKKSLNPLMVCGLSM